MKCDVCEDELETPSERNKGRCHRCLTVLSEKSDSESNAILYAAIVFGIVVAAVTVVVVL